jgi:spore coat protein A
MHIHLINFQYYKKADIDALKYAEDWYAANGGNPPYLKRPIIMVPDKYLASNWEKLDGVKRVFRDVDNVEPHTVAVFRFRFRHNNGQPFSFNTRIGEYIWHCHILEHEDNEMMRPFVVQ